MKNNKIKVAQIIGHTCNGGVESFVMNYYKNIDKTKFSFTFFVDAPSKIIDKSYIESFGDRIIIIPSIKNPFKYVNFLRKVFRENKFDIVHSNLNTLNVFPLFAAKKESIKVRISHSHSTTSQNEFFRNLIKKFLKLFSKKYVTHYFACSIEAGKWMFGKSIIGKENFFVIKNGIDITRFQFDETKRLSFREKNNLKDELIIGTSGRFVSQKNHLFLIKCFNDYLKCVTDKRIKLIIIGEGKLKNEYINYIKANKLESNVLLLDSMKDIEYFYSAIDIFAFPSIYEGLGISLIEAQVSGLPCVISKFIPREAICNENVFVTENQVNLRVKRFAQCSNFIDRKISNKIYDYDISINVKNIERLYNDFANRSL